MDEILNLEKKAAQIRLDTLKAISNANSGCSGSCMSIVEILVSLYYGEIYGKAIFNCDSKNPGWEGQDYFVLSKSKAAPTLYSILADKEFFDKSELNFLGKPNSLLTDKPNCKIPGISASVFSHGHGLSIGLGMALSLKMDRKKNRVFVLLGDGELQDGQIWEAAMAAAHYNLSNLIIFVDNNKVQRSGLISSTMDVGNIQNKFESFGWNVIKVMDGHNFDELLDAFLKASTVTRRPVCIWCNTICGKGIDFAERKHSYLDVPLSESELNEVFSKLNA